ncbi:MAG TPA: putative quinol monooxygenase [Candidatus Binatia bacterium]|jgi:quinol monooxygenase YgiN|nr:putative quinol monooxygenase [Candidatus Binatia bacterium]
MIVIAGTIPIKADQRDEARKLVLRMAEETRKEAGCLTYSFYADLADPNTFFIFEEWESDEALGRHFQTEHMKKFQQQAPQLLAGKVNAKKYAVESATPL